MAPVLLLVLLGVLSVNCELYPHSQSKDTILTTGHAEYADYFSGEFLFYGLAYSRMYLNFNGPLSFGTMFSSAEETTALLPGIPFLTAFWDDLSLDNGGGHFAYRKSKNMADITRASEDLTTAGFDNPIEYVIVATWVGVQHKTNLNADNTFQVVIAVGFDCSLFAIMNYEVESINFADPGVAVINKGDNVHNYQIPVMNDWANAATYTNIGLPGTVVVRLDEATLSQDPGHGVCRVCTSTTGGDVNQYFHGLTSELNDFPSRDGEKRQITRTMTPEFVSNTDKCKFGVLTVLDDEGEIKWIAVNLGVHRNPRKHKRSYTFNKVEGRVQERGQGVKAHSLDLPYTWSDGKTSIRITGDSSRWILEETGDCGYKFVIGPDGPEPMFVGMIEKTTILGGACGPLWSPADLAEE